MFQDPHWSPNPNFGNNCFKIFLHAYPHTHKITTTKKITITTTTKFIKLTIKWICYCQPPRTVSNKVCVCMFVWDMQSFHQHHTLILLCEFLPLFWMKKKDPNTSTFKINRSLFRVTFSYGTIMNTTKWQHFENKISQSPSGFIYQLPLFAD